jgi:hypothetical protein
VGAPIATLPFAVIEKLLTHGLTLQRIHLLTDDVVPEYAELLGS